MQLNLKSQHKHEVGKKIHVHGFEQELLFVYENLSSEKLKRRNCIEKQIICLFVCIEA